MMSSGGPWTCQEGRDRRGPRTRLWWSYKICSWSAQLWIWAFYPSPINLLAKVSNSLNCASAKIKNLFKIEAEVEARIMKMPITTWKFKLQSLFSIQEWDPHPAISDQQNIQNLRSLDIMLNSNFVTVHWLHVLQQKLSNRWSNSRKNCRRRKSVDLVGELHHFQSAGQGEQWT